MRYEKGNILLKGLKFNWNLITQEKGENNKYHEVFNIEIENLKFKNKIRVEFGNSIMEAEISNKIEYAFKNKFPFIQLRDYIRPNMWAGYDEDLNNKKIRNLNGLYQKRIYWLLLGVIIDFSSYINFEDYTPTFNYFCDEFGYDKDSRKAENIYKKCGDYAEKIRSLNLSKEQEEYFLNEARSETDIFIKDLKEEIQKQY